MKTHVESRHPKLVAHKKLAIIEHVDASHSKKPKKKQFVPPRCVIMTYFGATNPSINMMRHNKFFFKNLILYIYKGYMPFSTCDNIWL
jgi:hypothetical protein